ncbi:MULTISPECIES: aldo/keto reductase [unclassified Chromohalobacter]|uniref:aldo/keto reductase n=1 Tax=unclassified Chromohalobacter TaxID=2628571 RepID=UPI0024698C4A|nr:MULTISPECIES: aldo/keto reductase [unclassified Chromohalobacter]
MESITIPGTDLTPSRVGLGTWAIGGWKWGGADDANAVRTIHAALDRGITLIDTAPAYGFGHSEEVVGRALAEYGQRDKVVLATKTALEWQEGSDGVVRNASAARIEKEVEDSLRRLRTEAIDLYQVHWPDPRVPMEETADAMQRLYRAGKIRAIGVSNFSPEQFDAFRQVAPLHSVQPPLNLFERDAERDIIPYSQREGLVFLAYGALCRGLLTGKMHADSAFTGDDLRQSDPKFQSPRFAQYLAAVEALTQLAREHHDKPVLALAVRWVLDSHPNAIALWGARRPDQVTPLDALGNWSLTSSDLRDIDAIIDEHVTDPVGPEFMAPPAREE